MRRTTSCKVSIFNLVIASNLSTKITRINRPRTIKSKAFRDVLTLIGSTMPRACARSVTSSLEGPSWLQLVSTPTSEVMAEICAWFVITSGIIPVKRNYRKPLLSMQLRTKLMRSAKEKNPIKKSKNDLTS